MNDQVARDAVERFELLDLVTRLGRWLDTGDVDDRDGLARIYSENAVVQSPRGSATGLDAILDYVRLNSTPGDRSQHLVTDVLIETAGQTADISANSLVYVFHEGSLPIAQPDCTNASGRPAPSLAGA